MGYTQSSRTVAHLITDWRHHEHRAITRRHAIA